MHGGPPPQAKLRVRYATAPIPFPSKPQYFLRPDLQKVSERVAVRCPTDSDEDDDTTGCASFSGSFSCRSRGRGGDIASVTGPLGPIPVVSPPNSRPSSRIASFRRPSHHQLFGGGHCSPVHSLPAAGGGSAPPLPGLPNRFNASREPSARSPRRPPVSVLTLEDGIARAFGEAGAGDVLNVPHNSRHFRSFVTACEELQLPNRMVLRIDQGRWRAHLAAAEQLLPAGATGKIFSHSDTIALREWVVIFQMHRKTHDPLNALHCFKEAHGPAPSLPATPRAGSMSPRSPVSVPLFPSRLRRPSQSPAVHIPLTPLESPLAGALTTDQDLDAPELISCLAAELRRAGEEHHDLESLVLCMLGAPLTVDMLVAILAAVEGQCYLRKLTLRQCGLESSSVMLFGEWGLRFPPALTSALHTLDLSGNRIRCNDLHALCAVVVGCPHVASLSLRNNPLGGRRDESFDALVRLLGAMDGRLEHLDVGLCGITDVVAVRLCRSLAVARPHTGFRRLNIDGASLSHAAATLLLYTVDTTTNLLELGVRFVVACSARAYLRHMDRALRRNISAAISRRDYLKATSAATATRGRRGHVSSAAQDPRAIGRAYEALSQNGRAEFVTSLQLTVHPTLEQLEAEAEQRRELLDAWAERDKLRRARRRASSLMSEGYMRAEVSEDLPSRDASRRGSVIDRAPSQGSSEPDTEDSDWEVADPAGAALIQFLERALPAGYGMYQHNATQAVDTAFASAQVGEKYQRALHALQRLGTLVPMHPKHASSATVYKN